ncbi:MAG: hypothetical protein AAF968_09985 [Pseudomonadota bacterium]
MTVTRAIIVATTAAVFMSISEPAAAGKPNVGATESCISIGGFEDCKRVILAPCKRWEREETRDIWGKCVRRLGRNWRRVARQRLAEAISERSEREGEHLTAVVDAYLEAGRRICRRRQQVDVPHLRKLPRHACELGVAISAALIMRDPEQLIDGMSKEYEL